MAENRCPLGLFDAVGVELEYMIVGAADLEVAPISDRVLQAEAGHLTGEVVHEDISWSNELALHVIELKTARPVTTLEPVAGLFAEHVARVQAHLAGQQARLMPTAMHPWMDPHTQMRLWPHDQSPIYEAFHRIFDCRGHGWANLQSVHINLPFADDEQFGRLHAAIRLLLPILPALAASSPVVEGRAPGPLDNRLIAYRGNCARIPSVTGQVIPEPVFTMLDYHEQVLGRMYRDIAPHDPDGILQEEWLNARGAIARFDRNAIEIRVIDVQECPAADLAVVAASVEVLKLLVAETFTALAEQQALGTADLARLFDRTVRDGERAVLDHLPYLRVMGWRGQQPPTAAALWGHLIERVNDRNPAALGFCREPLAVLLERGPLARRILQALDRPVSPARLRAVYRRLCDCLQTNRMFEGL